MDANVIQNRVNIHRLVNGSDNIDEGVGDDFIVFDADDVNLVGSFLIVSSFSVFEGSCFVKAKVGQLD